MPGEVRRHRVAAIVGYLRIVEVQPTVRGDDIIVVVVVKERDRVGIVPSRHAGNARIGARLLDRAHPARS
jgi:hypothetical protein